jgi:DNA-binding beta-propeller fold protein YncE
MRSIPRLSLISVLLFTASCNKLDQYWKHNPHAAGIENAETFTEIGTIDIGDAGAAEISAYDPGTKRLFVVNNGEVNKIDVIDASNPVTLSVINSIDLTKYNGVVNSVDVHKGLLAAAIEAGDKQANGVVAVFKTNDFSEVRVVTAGALPDMITFSPDGKFILTANEGEPSTDYTNDPVGSISIISVDNDYQSVNLDFSSFAGQADALKAQGLRMYGPGASFAQDMEPEYVTVSKDSKTAWVTLQENNTIAKIDLQSKTVTAMFPLGFKDYSRTSNGIDPSDRDDQVAFRKTPAYGIYEPDAIAVLEKNGTPFLFTANEGDAREYDAFEEVERVKDVTLDENAFKDADELQNDEQIGRLNITTTLGKNSEDNFEALYSLGARSFSVWNGNDGKQVFDSKNNLEQEVVAAGLYDDARSDDKGVEPEGIAIGEINGKPYAFIGMERADAVAIYDISNPHSPVFVKVMATGDGPEGVLFISKKDSPVNRSLLVISSENDGVIRVYAPLN